MHSYSIVHSLLMLRAFGTRYRLTFEILILMASFLYLCLILLLFCIYSIILFNSPYPTIIIIINFYEQIHLHKNL